MCSKKNSGEVMLVRDRQNKNKLLICTNDNDIFGWRTLDGKLRCCNICIYYAQYVYDTAVFRGPKHTRISIFIENYFL
jgi:hypothetical protein